MIVGMEGTSIEQRDDPTLVRRSRDPSRCCAEYGIVEYCGAARRGGKGVHTLIDPSPAFP
jgi:hypothetical protein